MVRDRVRHVGDTVAMVVAESLDAARDAAELIAVDYVTLPAVVETASALDPGRPLVWDETPGNLAFDWGVGDPAAAERAMAGARHRITLEIVNNRIVVVSMEPRGALGEYDMGDNSYTLWSSTQGSHLLRAQLAESIFKVPENRIRVVTQDVGGGFGMKAFLYPEHVLVLWAAKRLGRPVKWTPERSDAFMTDTHGRDNATRLELALDGDWRFLGLSVTNIANMGAYLSNLALGDSDPVGHGHVQRRLRCPGDPSRGQGRLHQYRAGRRLSRRWTAGGGLRRRAAGRYGAARLGAAPAADLRRRNFIRPQRCPTRPRSVSSMTAATSHATWTMRSPRAEYAGVSRATGRPLPPAACYRGLGVRHLRRNSRGTDGDEFAELRFDSSGTLPLLIGTQSSGQGHQTAYAQLAAERLGLGLDKIRVLQGDTAAISFGRGTGGSRSLPVGGASVDAAAQKLIAKGRRIAAHLLEAAEAGLDFADGAFRIAGTDREIGIAAVARAAFDPTTRRGVEPGFAESGHFTRLRRPSPMAAMPARSKSIPRPGMSRLSAIWSSTISARWSTRCCCTARCRAGWRKVSARRCSSAPCSTPRPGSS